MADAKVATSKTGRRSSGRGGASRAGAQGKSSDRDGEQERADARPLCGFALCPICTVLTAVGEAKPDLVEHLLVASREVLLAARALIDSRLEGSAGGSGEHPTLQRLSIE